MVKQLSKRMDGLKLIVLCLMFFKVFCAIDKLFLPEDSKVVQRFIRNLVNSEADENSERIRDVAILRCEIEGENLFDEVVGEIEGENVLITPQCRRIISQRIRAASFIIILSDITDSVSQTVLQTISLIYLI